MFGDNLLPFNNLSITKNQQDSLNSDISKVLASGHFLNSTETKKFEASFGEYLGVKNVITCGNGTDALYLALASLNLPIGSEIMMTANSGLYAASAAVRLGLIPLYIDIDQETCQINLSDLKNCVSKVSRVLIITHLFGIANQMDIIMDICSHSNVMVIEDVAQAAGGEFRGKKLGSFGLLSTFSFYPTKNLGAIGDGGAIVTNDEKLDAKIRMLKQYGWSKRYNSDLPGGINSRIDEIQACVLNFRLKLLDNQNDLRQQLIKNYQGVLGKSKSKILGGDFKPRENVGHLAVIRANPINKVKQIFEESRIETMIHYPIPDHFQISLKGKFKVHNNLINTENFTNEILSIPCNLNLSETDILHIQTALERVSIEFR